MLVCGWRWVLAGGDCHETANTEEKVIRHRQDRGIGCSIWDLLHSALSDGVAEVDSYTGNMGFFWSFGGAKYCCVGAAFWLHYVLPMNTMHFLFCVNTVYSMGCLRSSRLFHAHVQIFLSKVIHMNAPKHDPLRSATPNSHQERHQ